MKTPNYHILLVRHMSMTNRVRIKSELLDETIYIPYTNEPGEMVRPLDEAKKYLESNGHPIIGIGELNNDYVIIVDAVENSFKNLK